MVQKEICATALWVTSLPFHLVLFIPMQLATTWQLRTRQLTFSSVPKLMGIVNVTPDSFSDGGLYAQVTSAVDHALRLEDEGCDILDIGGESTRPYSDPVAVDDELKRVIPVIEKLAKRVAIPISIDTSKSRVASAAIDCGVEIINDVTGLEGDPDMLSVAVRTQAGVCAMHMQGTPKTLQDNPQYDDVVQDILGYLRARREQLTAGGIELQRICLDPGIGFGKTHEHNLQLLQHVEVFHQLNCPILIGHSRKGMIAKVIGNKEVSRMPGTIGISLAMALKRIQVLRVHDVAENRQALQLFQASGAISD
jgi:dihydropteroate synthase